MLYPWKGCTTDFFVTAFDVTCGDDLQPFKLFDGFVIGVPDLNIQIKEADLRLVLHALHAAQDGFKRIVILSQDTDVLILCLHNWISLTSYGLEELWVTAGLGDTLRYIPVHTLAIQLGATLCQVLPAVHTLTECDYTSKFGTKAAALKATQKCISRTLELWRATLKIKSHWQSTTSSK